MQQHHISYKIIIPGSKKQEGHGAIGVRAELVRAVGLHTALGPIPAPDRWKSGQAYCQKVLHRAYLLDSESVCNENAVCGSR